MFQKIWDSHVVHADPGGQSIIYIDLQLVHEVRFRLSQGSNHLYCLPAQSVSNLVVAPRPMLPLEVILSQELLSSGLPWGQLLLRLKESVCNIICFDHKRSAE